MTLGLTPILRRRLLLLTAVIFTLWASWKVGNDDSVEKTVVESAIPSRYRSSSKTITAAPALTLNWGARAEKSLPVADIFSLVPPVALPSSAVVAPPPAPELKLKFMGQLDGGDNNHVFLTDAKDIVITAKVGQTVADEWQLETMDSTHLVFRHIASGHKQTMLIGTTQ
jgi:hypothetical protein